MQRVKVYTMFVFQNDMCALKSDNDRLQRMVHSSQSLNTSQSSIIHNRTSSESIERTISLSENTSIGKGALNEYLMKSFLGLMNKLAMICQYQAQFTPIFTSLLKMQNWCLFTDMFL